MSYTPEDKRRYFLLVVLIIVNITIEYSLSRFAYIIDIKKQNWVYGEEQLTKEELIEKQIYKPKPLHYPFILSLFTNHSINKQGGRLLRHYTLRKFLSL